MPVVQRAMLGFLAGAVSVLTFHAAAWYVLHLFGMMPLPYPMNPTAPLGVPVIVSLMFWGAVYGALFGIALPSLAGPKVAWGAALGLLACLVGWFIVGPLKGRPVLAGSIMIPLVVNVTWGIGVSLLLSWIMSARARTGAPAAARL